MVILELQTPEAKYRNNMAGGCHFSIDCSCGGKKGKYIGAHYTGSHYKEIDERSEKEIKDYKPLRERKFEHTFMLSELILLHLLS